MDSVQIGRHGCFSLEEAQNLLPIIHKITASYSARVRELVERLERFGQHESRLVTEIEAQVSELISQWQCKVQKLGAQPKGLWIADFDSGDGYYCWKFPESNIKFWHSYEDGFTRRVPVRERIPRRIVGPGVAPLASVESPASLEGHASAEAHASAEPPTPVLEFPLPPR